MGWRLRISDKTVRKLAATKMYPRERCFWQYKVYADIRRGLLERGCQMRVGFIENADFRFIRSLSSEYFTYMAT